MAIDDITKQPLGLIKVTQVVLLVISIGCVFGAANGWWYYVGATLIAAFINTIIMLICYYWKQTFESSFLELSYTSYFVVALFISAILLFAQPQYAEAPWKQPVPSTLNARQTSDPLTPTINTTSPLITTKITIPTPKTKEDKTNATTSPPPTTTPSTSPPTTTAATTTATTKTTTTATTESETTSPSTTKPITVPSTTASPTSPPPPPKYIKDGAWIAGGVFCIFLFITYSIELYFLTRRLITFGGRPTSSSPPMPSQPGI